MRLQDLRRRSVPWESYTRTSGRTIFYGTPSWDGPWSLTFTARNWITDLWKGGWSHPGGIRVENCTSENDFVLSNNEGERNCTPAREWIIWTGSNVINGKILKYMQDHCLYSSYLYNLKSLWTVCQVDESLNVQAFTQRQPVNTYLHEVTFSHFARTNKVTLSICAKHISRDSIWIPLTGHSGVCRLAQDPRS